MGYLCVQRLCCEHMCRMPEGVEMVTLLQFATKFYL